MASEQSPQLLISDPTTQQCSGAEPSRHFRLDGEINESTLHRRFAEREDRPHTRVDCRAGVMLAWLRALREWLLRRNRRPRAALERVSRGMRGGSWSEFCAKIAALRPGRLWRYAQAGDLPGYGPKIDGALLDELVAANTGKNVIAFTHKPVLGDDPVAVENRRLIAAAVKAGFTVNLSADNPAHADRLAELGIAPVVTVLARAYARRAVRHRFKRRRDEWAETIGEWRDRTASLPRYTPAGRRIAICPATYSDATCKTCGACAHVRDAVIGFPAHGAWRQVEAATGARDVPAGESWAFRDHRTMAEVIAGEATAA